MTHPPTTADATAPKAARRATATASVLTVVLTTATASTIRQDGYVTDPVGLSLRYAVCWVLFAAAVMALRHAPARHTAALVLAGSVAMAATGLLAPPSTSTDSFRYAWDGRVQAAGISPYDHAPADPALVPLRDTWLFPTGPTCGRPDLTPVSGGVCTRINRPQVHTIYPPAAELAFLLVHTASPDGARHQGLQTAGAVLAVAVTLLLLRILRDRGDPRTAAYWAWCPAVPLEAVNNAHVDTLAVLLSVAALGLTARHRPWGGALLGLATAVKFLPAVLLPGILSGVRRPREVAATLVPVAAVLAVLYLPYAYLSHSSVLGYLGGYAEEEGYQDPSSGNRYALLRLVLPDSWAVPAVIAGMLTVSLYVIRRGDPGRPWSGALLVTGTAFLLTTPGYSWYALLLIALVALDGRWEWLAVAVAGAACYVTARAVPGAGTIAYPAAALAVAVVSAVRTGRPPVASRVRG
ncbi:glycosyltransferase family 87 protein [Streptomyces sp. NPDC051921]|uniref:glycosyltransferase family 87 protein n=1 Tax=Streptomyces sp. NPDC051921 TaxID=3155806 RepID=UPI00342EA177